MAQLKVDLSGRNGLAPRYWGDLDRDSTPFGTASAQPQLRYVAGDGQMVDGYYNPFRRYGFLSAANTYFKDVDQPTTFTAIPNCCVYDDVNNDLIVGSNGRYFQALMDGLDDVQFYKGSSYGDYGTSGTPTVKDLDIYQINGVRKLFTVYETGGNIEVGYYPLAYDSGGGTDAFFSGRGGGTISFNRVAFMRVADNGYAYLFNDNAVHKMDGTTGGTASGTVYPNVLVFPPSFTITDALDFKGSFFIALTQGQVDPQTLVATATTYSIACGVYVWNRQSTSVSTVDYIPIQGIKMVHKMYVTSDGRLRAIVTNAEHVVEIREYNGSTFVVICEVARGASPQWHDSVSQTAHCVIWLGRNGDIYAHGRVTFREQEGLFKIGTLAESPNSTGFIFFGGGNDYSSSSGFKRFRTGLYLGYTDGNGAAKVKQWDMYGTGAASSSAGTDNKMLTGDVYSPLFYLPEMSKVKSVTVYMAQGSGSGSSSAGTIDIYFNGSATTWGTKTVTRDQHATGYKHIEVNKPYVNAIQFKIAWPANTSTVGNFDIAPSYAIVEYEPQQAKG